eukprot:3841206-Amphidinium_carterae.1
MAATEAILLLAFLGFAVAQFSLGIEAGGEACIVASVALWMDVMPETCHEQGAQRAVTDTGLMATVWILAASAFVASASLEWNKTMFNILLGLINAALRALVRMIMMTRVCTGSHKQKPYNRDGRETTASWFSWSSTSGRPHSGPAVIPVGRSTGSGVALGDFESAHLCRELCGTLR